MVINYLGNGSFKLQSGQASLLVDPESNRFKADVTLRTIVSASANLAASPDVEISFPGEYEVKGVEIFGIGVPEESSEKFLKTVYLVEWEGVKLAFLGHLSKPPSANVVEELDEPDIVFLPVAGGHFLSAEDAAKLAKKLEPSFIVPSFYKNPADFSKAMGQKTIPEEKLVFKRKDLEGVKNKVVVLKT